MRRKTKYAFLCTLSVIGLSMTGITGMAEGESESELIAIPYDQEGAWDKVAMTNDDAVSTGINIRATADEDGEIIGFLYRGGAAWVIEKGETWTELCSGDLTGFVKNEYLLYGRDVTGLAEYYGRDGVTTTWDDVKLFATADGSSDSDVVRVLETGDSFPLVEDTGHWLEVQYTADDTAYLSSDDVTRVILLDTAISKDGIYRGQASIGASDESSEDENAYTEPAYTEPTYTETEPAYTEPAYTEPTYTQTEAPQTEAPQTEAPQTEAPQTEAPQTEAPQTEAPQTEAPQTEAPQTEAPQTEATQTEAPSDDDNGDLTSDGYYDADTGTYIDGNGNVVDSTFDAVYDDSTYYEETYTEETEAYVEQTEAYVEQTEAYVEQTEAYVEQTEAYVEETEAASTSSGTDDTSLLAALIYCEAGNQSYEGMVAVGAVVMNRVYSSSFPNTISDVIYQSGQFTPASSGSLSSALANGVPSTCYEAASAAIGGENPVGGALYFNTGSGQGTKIGDHQFY